MLYCALQSFRGHFEAILTVRCGLVPHRLTRPPDQTGPRFELIATVFDRSFQRPDDIRWLPRHHCIAVVGFWSCVGGFVGCFVLLVAGFVDFRGNQGWL